MAVRICSLLCRGKEEVGLGFLGIDGGSWSICMNNLRSILAGSIGVNT